MFDFNVALQLLLPLETPATGRTRIHTAPMPDSHVTWQVQVCAWAAATNPAHPWLPRRNWWMNDPMVVSYVVSSEIFATDVTANWAQAPSHTWGCFDHPLHLLNIFSIDPSPDWLFHTDHSVHKVHGRFPFCRSICPPMILIFHILYHI